MKRGGGGRPDGSDGSDFAFRMTVDDRYRKAAQGKLTLRKYITAQYKAVVDVFVSGIGCAIFSWEIIYDHTVFQLLKVSVTIFTLVSGEGTVENLQVAACVFGVIAVLLGTLGLKQGASKLLKIYIFLTSLTIGLTLVSIIIGNFYEKMSYLRVYKTTKDYKKISELALEGAQDIIGTLVGAQGIYVTQNLLGYMSPPKRTV